MIAPRKTPNRGMPEVWSSACLYASPTDFAQVVYEAVKQHSRTPFREEVWQQLANEVAGERDDVLCPLPQRR